MLNRFRIRIVQKLPNLPVTVLIISRDTRILQGSNLGLFYHVVYSAVKWASAHTGIVKQSLKNASSTLN
jgi:hypothetical protein